MTKKKNKISIGKVMALGATVAAAGAEAYYLFGPNAKKHQKKTKAFISKAKNQVVKTAKKEVGRIKKEVSKIKKNAKRN